MNSRLGAILLSIALVSPACWADDTSQSSAPANASDSGDKSASDKQAATPQSLCVRECTRASARCTADVRHARSECSRSAAMEGEDPMGSSRDVEAFCGYFRNASTCVSKNADRHCTERFRRRYTQCVAQVRPNVMSTRYDCFQEERQAEGMCRSELNECKAACY
jgi:hypothetical protein